MNCFYTALLTRLQIASTKCDILHVFIRYSGEFKEGVGEGAAARGVGEGAAASLLTGCILNQVKNLHKNALFLHKIFKSFLERRHKLSPNPLPFRPLHQISGSATVYILSLIHI